MEYTRELFIELIGRNFAEVRRFKGKFYIGNDNDGNKVSQDKIADLIDYDPKQFGSCLNPKKRESYKTAIKRLMKYEKIKNLEKKVKELEIEKRELKSLQKKELESLQKKGNRRNITAIVFGLTAFMLAIISFFRLPSELEKTIEANPPHKEKNGYIVKDELTFENIMSWHGEITANRLAKESLILNERVKQLGNTLTKKDEQKLISDAITGITSAMSDGRQKLGNIGFTSADGTNLAAILKKIAPYDSLFNATNPLFTEAFKEGIPYLLSKEETALSIADKIEKLSKKIQRDQWSLMKKEMNITDE